MLPEGSDKSFAALGSLELGAGKGAEFGKVLWTEVWHLVLFPMSPQVLDRIELWRIGRQEFKLDVAAFALDVAGDLAAAMGLQTIQMMRSLRGARWRLRFLRKATISGARMVPLTSLK